MTDLELYEQLCAFITPERRDLFDRIVAQRTRHVTVVLEDIYQTHNASAVLRTCDLLGVQDVHIIERRNTYKVDDQVALGSSQWLDLHKHQGSDDGHAICIEDLRRRGYRIVATSPHADAHTPHEIPLDAPLALCFGTELTGLSDALMRTADLHLRIPMYGFTESYNISVSAAIALFTITERLRHSDIPWRLSETDMQDIKLRWVRRSLHRSDLIEQHLRARREDG